MRKRGMGVELGISSRNGINEWIFFSLLRGVCGGGWGVGGGQLWISNFFHQ